MWSAELVFELFRIKAVNNLCPKEQCQQLVLQWNGVDRSHFHVKAIEVDPHFSNSNIGITNRVYFALAGFIQNGDFHCFLNYAVPYFQDSLV